MTNILHIASDLATSGKLSGSPAYIYDSISLSNQLDALMQAFGDDFTISYAIKANPNPHIIKQIANRTGHLDASSYFEVVRALRTGLAPGNISYSGPGKRASELRGFIGLGAALVVESEDEITLANTIATELGAVQDVLLRINPDHVPKGFGASMSSRPSQFGVDEAQVERVLDLLSEKPALNLIGFHVYAGSNCLKPEAIAENFSNILRLFRAASQHADFQPLKLIFGAGFGLPYHEGSEELMASDVRKALEPAISELKSDPILNGAEAILEMGRWIVGPCGALITTVLSTKVSRGVNVVVCDAGFNAHLAACGMMGAVFQKNYPFAHLTAGAGETKEYLITGPLCTSIDTLARKIQLPEISVGDQLAVLMSGAYGLTASPMRFISHADPLELLWTGTDVIDITETQSNIPPAGGLADWLKVQDFA